MKHSSPDVTICVVPRERYSCAIDSLENIVRNTDGPYKLVYVDGNSPTAIATQLAQLCRAGGFTYLREDRFLTPNHARNIGLKVIDTDYVAFVDNDLFVQPGWLQPLVECARETGAWAVGPVVLEGSENLSVIHMAGGDLIGPPVRDPGQDVLHDPPLVAARRREGDVEAQPTTSVITLNAPIAIA